MGTGVMDVLVKGLTKEEKGAPTTFWDLIIFLIMFIAFSLFLYGLITSKESAARESFRGIR